MSAGGRPEVWVVTASIPANTPANTRVAATITITSALNPTTANVVQLPQMYDIDDLKFLSLPAGVTDVIAILSFDDDAKLIASKNAQLLQVSSPQRVPAFEKKIRVTPFRKLTVYIVPTVATTNTAAVTVTAYLYVTRYGVGV